MASQGWLKGDSHIHKKIIHIWQMVRLVEFSMGFIPKLKNIQPMFSEFAVTCWNIIRSSKFVGLEAVQTQNN